MPPSFSVSGDSSRKSSSANHTPHIELEQGTVGQLVATFLVRAEERTFPILGHASGGDVLVEVAIQIVMRRQLVLFAGLLVESRPRTSALQRSFSAMRNRPNSRFSRPRTMR